jgi:DNA-binding XRE family transcriptional regulator
MKATQIKRVREQRRETQAEFAKHFGVARTTIIAWEANGTPTTGPGQYHIAAVLADLAKKRPQSEAAE